MLSGGGRCDVLPGAVVQGGGLRWSANSISAKISPSNNCNCCTKPQVTPRRLSPTTRLFSCPLQPLRNPSCPLDPPFITSPPFWRFCVNCCHMTGRQAKGCAKCKVDQGCPWEGVVGGGHGRCVASSRLVFLFGRSR